MSTYVDTIKIAIIIFPIIAFLFTIPFMLHQYHKYGSVYFYRILIVYSFILYLLATYFLIILPLPTFEEVANLTTPSMQIIPFQFIIDFFTNTSFVWNDISTYLPAIKTMEFLQPTFNIILCIPFGVYLHYYFKCDLKKTVFFTFLLSLFFELTQLTGLYFIYPRSYRLFDIDDLFCNTLGGFIGFFIGSFFLKFLPSREKIDQKALELGTKVSFTKRMTAFFLDAFLFHLLSLLFIAFFPKNRLIIYLIFLFLYYCVIPILNKKRTFAHQFLNLELKSYRQENTKNYQIVLYQGLFFLFYIAFLPLSYIFLRSIYSLNFISHNTYIYLILTVIILYIIFCFVSFVLKLFKHLLWYEQISTITLKSTIKHQKNTEKV